VEDFYRRRVELSARAGIRYWKVDWGAGNGVAGIRALGEGDPVCRRGTASRRRV